MATKTMILRPTSWTNSSSQYTPYPAETEVPNYYLLISEEVADDEGTYLTSTGTMPFTGAMFSIPNPNIIPTAIRIVARMRTSVSNSQGELYYCCLDDNSTSGVSFKALDKITLTTQYETYTQAIPSEYITAFWAHTISDDISDYHISFCASTTSTSSKATKEARLTQLYLEVDYEEPDLVMYVKSENNWLPIYNNSIYKKVDGVWQLSTIDSESIQNKIDWEHYYLTFTELKDGTYSVKATDISNLPSTIYIPKTHGGKPVTVIEEGAFRDAAITNVIISNGIKTIGRSSFYNCTSLTSVTIPDSITTIEFNAFSECTSLTNVVIPDSVTSIGDYAFDGCSSLASVEIGDGVTSIGNRAFYACSSLESVVIGDSVASIGDYAFAFCTKLTNINIPDSVTTIGTYAFESCTGLTNAAIGDSVTTISDYAFYRCSRLTSVIIPDSVTIIGKHAFFGCDNLTIYCETESRPNGWDANWNSANCPVVWGYTATDPSYFTFAELDDGTYSVATSDKENMPSEIVIPATYNGKDVTLVTLSAFAGCSFTSVTIPDTVTEIALHAFQNCPNLANLVIGNSVTSIGYRAFDNCYNLASVVMGDGVTSIDDYAFENCGSLTDVYITNLNNWYNIAFSNSSSNPLCYADNLYLNGELITNLVIPDDITQIKPYMFYGYSSLTSIDIPDSITSIGNSAFSSCDSLVNVTIPDSVTEIGGSVFSDCVSLAELNLGNGIKTIPSSMAYGCNKLKSIVIPDSATSIGDAAFEDCSSLTSVTIGNGVTSIGKNAFQYCSSLTSVVIGDSVTTIGDNAFIGCSNLYVVYNNSDLLLEIGSTNNGYVTYYAKVLIDHGETTYVSDGYNYTLTDDGFLFREKDSKYELIAYIGGEDTVTLPENINGNSYNLSGMRGVINVIIPESFTTINDAAFSNRSNLTSVVIPDSVTSIGSTAFAYCSSLTNITFEGTMEQWAAISFGSNWNTNVPATYVQCSDGQVTL